MVRNLRELGVTLQKLVNRLLENQNLLKLLYYTNADPLSMPDLTKEQIQTEIFNNLIRVTPSIKIEDSAQSKIGVRITDGFINTSNKEYRNIIVDFEVYVPLVSWIIKDVNFRVFAILGEIQESLGGKIVNGVGRFQCGDFDLNFVDAEVACYILHGKFMEYD